MKSHCLILGLMLLMGCLAADSFCAELSDHPLLTRYPESIISRKDVEEFAEYNLIIGLDEQGELQAKSLQGKLTRVHYQHPRDRSSLEIFKNYEDALVGAGMEVLFNCANEECGPAYAASKWNRINGITTKSGANCRYLAGRMDAGRADVYVAVMVGQRRHQIDIVEIKAMESGLVKVDADAMAASIERLGYVSIYGIYFDTGKSDLKPDSEPTLEEIAKLLRDRPQLQLYVVGHTDNVGTLAYNMQLSKSRARAVVDALVDELGVSGARLDPHGVGPLVPRATNSTDDGRAKNRRVELVAQ